MILPISPSLCLLRLTFQFCFPLYKGPCLTSCYLSKQRRAYSEAKTRAWVIPETLAELITVGIHMMYRRRFMASSVSYLLLSLAAISPRLHKCHLKINDILAGSFRKSSIQNELQEVNAIRLKQKPFLR
jgi:hypothetical protein